MDLANPILTWNPTIFNIIVGRNDSSTKRLMFQVLFSYPNFLQNSLQRLLQFIFVYFWWVICPRDPVGQYIILKIVGCFDGSLLQCTRLLLIFYNFDNLQRFISIFTPAQKQYLVWKLTSSAKMNHWSSLFGFRRFQKWPRSKWKK